MHNDDVGVSGENLLIGDAKPCVIYVGKDVHTTGRCNKLRLDIRAATGVYAVAGVGIIDKDFKDIFTLDRFRYGIKTGLLAGDKSIGGGGNAKYLAELTNLLPDALIIGGLADKDGNAVFLKGLNGEVTFKNPINGVQEIAAAAHNGFYRRIAIGQLGNGFVVGGPNVKRAARVVVTGISDDLVGKAQRTEHLCAVRAGGHNLLGHFFDGNGASIVFDRDGHIVGRRLCCGRVRRGLLPAGAQRKHHAQRKDDGKSSFHDSFSFCTYTFGIKAACGLPVSSCLWMSAVTPNTSFISPGLMI